MKNTPANPRALSYGEAKIIQKKYISHLSSIIEILSRLSAETELKVICRKAVFFAKNRLGLDNMEISLSGSRNKNKLSFLDYNNKAGKKSQNLFDGKDVLRIQKIPAKTIKGKVKKNCWKISIPIRSKTKDPAGIAGVISNFCENKPDAYTLSVLRLYTMGIDYLIQKAMAFDRIRSSDALHKRILNAVDSSILVLTPEIKLAFANDYFSRTMKQLGLPPLKAGDYFLKENPEYRKAFPKIQGYYNKIVKTKKPFNTIDSSAAGKKLTLYYEAKRIPVLNRKKELELIINISNNITFEKTTLNKLRQTEDFLENVFNSIQDGICVLDKHMNIIKVNKVMEKWYPDSLPLIGKKCFRAYHFRETPCIFCPTKKTLKTGKTCHQIVQKMGKSGQEGWLDLFAYPLKNQKTGKIEGAIEYVKNITKDKADEEQLIASETKYKELWNNAPVAYHTLSPEGIITSVNETELKMLGYSLKDMLGKPIFKFIEPSQREEARLRFLRKISGRETAKSDNRIYIRNGGAKIFVSVEDVLEYDRNHEVVSVRTTMIDVTRQRQIENALHHSFSKLKKNMDDAMRVIARLVEMRDPYTAGHQIRVAELACAIARELGLNEDTVEKIRMAGVMHDIGKINVPIEILSKPGKISESEMNIIKIHPSVGYEILKEMDFPYPVAEAVLQQHERMDGEGYPGRLRPNRILMEARILMVADVVEAMSSHRPYRPSKGLKEALKEIQKNKNKLYDPNVAKACLNVFKKTKFVFSEN